MASARYGLVGIGALATLSLVHWARGWPPMGSAVFTYLLGVLANVLAAVAIPFVSMGIWADQKPDAPSQLAWKWFAGIAILTGIALIAWEFNQARPVGRPLRRDHAGAHPRSG